MELARALFGKKGGRDKTWRAGTPYFELMRKEGRDEWILRTKNKQELFLYSQFLSFFRL